jgi:putative addiction module killer protein
MQQGNFSNAKGAPGYRIYFGKDGARLIVLLGGGTKKRQPDDIAMALTRWEDYKLRKGTER